MDVPCKYSWVELVQLAQNRDSWRQRVRAIRQGPRIAVSLTTTTPNNNHFNNNSSSATNQAPKTQCSPQLAPGCGAEYSAKRYPQRDDHVLFFGAPSKRRRHRAAKPKAKKPRRLTDKEGAAFARAHYERHHGGSITSVWMAPAPQPDTPPTPKPHSSDIWMAPAQIHTPSPTSTSYTTLDLTFSPIILGHHNHQRSDSNNDRLSLSAIFTTIPNETMICQPTIPQQDF